MPIRDGRDDLIDRYVRNRLTEDERAAFELRLLDDDALFEEVERAQRMADALRAEQPVTVHRQAESGGVARFAIWLRQPLSMAAVLLLGLSFVLNAFRLGESGEAGPVGFAIGSATVLEAVRGADDVITIRGSGPHLLQIDAALSSSTVFTVTLRHLDDSLPELVWNDVMADGSGWLRVAVSGTVSGPLSLEVSGDAGDAWAYRLDFVND